MKNILLYILVEDDEDTCKRFSQQTETIEDIKLIATTNNAIKALEYIKDYQPHAIVLDLELHMGGGNGFDVLKGLKELNLTYIPYILITTNNSSNTTYELARQLGADFIMYKYQDSYSEKSVIEFLRMTTSLINSKINNCLDNTKNFKDSYEYEKHILNRVISELNNIGISAKSVGYKYLCDSIILTIHDKKEKICSLIGIKYKKTDSSVERAMQNAINRAWRITDVDDLLIYYKARINPNKGMPTLTEFICYYANKIKNDY